MPINYKCVVMMATTFVPACNRSSQDLPLSSTAAPSALIPALASTLVPAKDVESTPVQSHPVRVATQHLLVSYRGAASAPKEVSRSKADARKRAGEAARRAAAGEDFSLLVAEYSDDPSKVDRGNLGLFTRESKAAPFSDAAFGLAVGGISGVVETKYGFHVIKRNQ